MTYSEWLKEATCRLKSSETPQLDAEILLEFITHKTKTFLIAFGETLLTESNIKALNHCLQRRIEGEPIAYIIGKKEFWSLSFKVGRSTLIPRSDTEKLVELALEHLTGEACDILDLGTGTGAIAIAMASERSDCFFTAVDYNREAIKLAHYNADRVNVSNIDFLYGNWFKPVKDRAFTMIVSNPPYISQNDPHLFTGDIRFEPSSALIAGSDGLSEIRYIVEHSIRYLNNKGWLIIEHGWNQALDVRTIFKHHGFKLVKTYTDYSGHDRVTLGCYLNQ